MPYYPTFAFFEVSPQIKEIAQSLVTELGDELPEISFELNNGISKSQRTSFEDKKRARSFLKQQNPNVDISRFWLASELHSLEFSLAPKGYLVVDFWDFDSEVYDLGGPTEAMKLAKRKVALRLHRALVKDCGAWFSYTSSADNKYCGLEGHSDTAEAIFVALRQHEFRNIARILKKPLYFWLVGFRKGTAPDEALDEQLREDFHEINGEMEATIFEHKSNRPYFLM